MGDSNFLYYNGKISKTGKPLIYPDNRSFRYGDGFFETMKMVNGQIVLADLHFERLFHSLELLKFQKPVYFTKDYLIDQVKVLAKKNMHHRLGRIRLTIFRGEGGLYDVENHFPHHLIQSWELNPSVNRLNENGLVVDIFKEARKVCDHFSMVKSNNYLSYAMAALWAKQEKLNDAILLNPYDGIADATIANFFIVKDGLIKTPAISEGPVDGVMRKYILQQLKLEGIPFQETRILPDEIMQASEIFLTNAINGIKWVKQAGKNGFTNQMASLLFKKMVVPLAG